LLNETGVALLPSTDFGRPLSELSARLSYVNFDGAKALEAAKALNVLDEQFLKEYCKESLEAIRLISDWIKS
jgi:aspartate aminotransferase